MKHIHLNLHAHDHAIATVIVSSITVICIAAVEYMSLNSALAYEKDTLITQYKMQKEEKVEVIVDWQEDMYSDEASLNAAENLPDEAKMRKDEMSQALTKLLTSKKDNVTVKKLASIDATQRNVILQRINDKILELENSGLMNAKKYHKRLGHLLAVRELVLTK